jgi:nicotinate-nucleotide adenylyltransferase
MSAERWGILGGIFDPIHYAHLAIAEQAREALGLNGLLFVPAGQPVHRDDPHAPADDRLRMVELAIAGNPRFAVSRLEVDADRPSYTVDTIEALLRAEPERSFTLIASSETVALMPTTWHRVDRLLELAEVAVVRRLGYPDIEPAWLEDHFPGRAGRFRLLPTSLLGHSSADIRARVTAGKSIRYLVSPAVEQYIGEHRLYGSHDRPAA